MNTNKHSQSRSQQDSPPFATVVEQYLLDCRMQGYKCSTLRRIDRRLGEAVGQIGQIPISEVTPQHLTPIVFVPKRSSRGNREVYSCLRGLYSWCESCDYLPSGVRNALTAVPVPRVVNPPPQVQMISPAQAKHLLKRTALEANPFKALVLAFRLFSTLRRNELLQIEWTDIVQGEILVKSDNPNRSSKLLPMNVALLAWLSPFQSSHGRVIPSPSTWSAVSANVRKFTNLKPDCLRRSAIGFRLALIPSISQLAIEIGISLPPIQRILFQPVCNQLAKEYFALTPKACGIPDWNQRVKAYLQKIQTHRPQQSTRRPAKNAKSKSIKSRGPQAN